MAQEATMTAHALAILGTGSDVGKSVLTAGICRLLFRAGVRVAPFKAQNMSLNSWVTPDGGEIGRAQAVQAAACGIQPHVDMNPILLKPESDTCAQVVVRGRVCGKQEAAAYFDGRRTLWPVVAESYNRLASQYEMIAIEGAGSAAEINLRQHDLVNWPVVEMADAQVLLVGDIDKGGVFAQILGTLDLVQPNERDRVCGIVINKFRGDVDLFADGVTFLESRSGVPVLGVVPYLRDLMLDQEDSLDQLIEQQVPFSPDRVNIAVVAFPHLSNFTDFNMLSREEDVAVKYVRTPAAMADADILVLPGSKNTVHDLAYLREKGFVSLFDTHLKEERELVGICGGYQMLGRMIEDPDHVEQGGACRGLGYLDIATILTGMKKTVRVEARPTVAFMGWAGLIRGYEIHMGITRLIDESPCFTVYRQNQQYDSADLLVSGIEEGTDGAVRKDGLVWGTHIHGLFDEPGFRRTWLNRARQRKGLPLLDTDVSKMVSARVGLELDRWADHISHHLNFSQLFRQYPMLNGARW